jgi:hypothetical protein
MCLFTKRGGGMRPVRGAFSRGGEGSRGGGIHHWQTQFHDYDDPSSHTGARTINSSGLSMLIVLTVGL